MGKWSIDKDDKRYARDQHKPGKVERVIDKAVEKATGRCSWTCGDAECPRLCTNRGH